jgi:hypothetical protein
VKIFGSIIMEKWELYSFLIIGFVPIIMIYLYDISDGYIGSGSKEMPATSPWALIIPITLISSIILWAITLKYSTEVLEEDHQISRLEQIGLKKRK